jgi:hypothetical protein
VLFRSEEGGHGALLRRGGEYAQLYRLQASWYGDGARGASAEAPGGA